MTKPHTCRTTASKPKQTAKTSAFRQRPSRARTPAGAGSRDGGGEVGPRQQPGRAVCSPPSQAPLLFQNDAVLASIRRVFCLVQLYRSALAVGAYALLITAEFCCGEEIKSDKYLVCHRGERSTLTNKRRRQSHGGSLAFPFFLFFFSFFQTGNFLLALTLTLTHPLTSTLSNITDKEHIFHVFNHCH